MSGTCEVCGRGTLSGNNVSKSNKKTKRKFQINNNPGTLYSECLKRGIRVARLCNKCRRTIDHNDGFDRYALKFMKHLKNEASERVVAFAKQAVACLGASALQGQRGAGK